MAKIFISYRRDDAQWQAKAIHEKLSRHVENPREDIFYDLDSMTVGLNFKEQIELTVAKCDMLIALIGKDWLRVTDPATGQRRLNNPRDFVRTEIAAALQRNIPVVPVLLDGVAVPEADELPEDLRDLSMRHGVTINAASFDHDVNVLIKGLLGDREPVPTTVPPPRSTSSGNKIVAPLIGLILFAGLGLGTFLIDPLDWFSRETPRQSVASDLPQRALTADDGSSSEIASVDVAAEIRAEREARIEAVKRLQTGLKDLGLYTSYVDGSAGQGTMDAVEAFARQKNTATLDLQNATPAQIEQYSLRVEQSAREYKAAEAASWSIASRTATRASYSAYLDDYPNGTNASRARSAIAKIDQDAAAARAAKLKADADAAARALAASEAAAAASKQATSWQRTTGYRFGVWRLAEPDPNSRNIYIWTDSGDKAAEFVANSNGWWRRRSGTEERIVYPFGDEGNQSLYRAPWDDSTLTSNASELAPNVRFTFSNSANTKASSLVTSSDRITVTLHDGGKLVFPKNSRTYTYTNPKGESTRY